MFLFLDFIGHMYGPYFLILYGILAAVFSYILKYQQALLVGSKKEAKIQADITSDPYLIAYIRNGAREVVKLVILNLLQKQYFMVSKAKEALKVSKNAPPAFNLNAIEKMVFEKFLSSTPIRDVTDDVKINEAIQEGYIDHEIFDKYPDLLYSENERMIFLRFKIGAMVLLFGLAFFKFLTAINSGHNNVLFLVLLVAFVLVNMFKINLPRYPPLAEKFIGDLEILYRPNVSKKLPETSFNLLILAAIYGMKGTQYDYLDVRPKTSIADGGGGGSSSCGSSCSTSSGCGSSCSGGSSCGGGCGGCGGGGGD